MSSPDTGGKDSARLPGPAPPKAEAIRKMGSVRDRKS